MRSLVPVAAVCILLSCQLAATSSCFDASPVEWEAVEARQRYRTQFIAVSGNGNLAVTTAGHTPTHASVIRLANLRQEEAVLQSIGKEVERVEQVTTSLDGTVFACLLQDGRIIAYIRGERIEAFRGPGVVTQCAVSPDGSRIGVSTKTGLVLITIIDRTIKTRTWSRETAFSSVCFSADGKWLFSGSEDIAVWDLSTSPPSKVREITAASEDDSPGGDAPFETIVVSADGSHIAAGGEDGLTVWDLKRSDRLTAFTSRGNAVWDAEFSPDGRLLATYGGACRDNGMGGSRFLREIVVWQTADGKLKKLWQDPEMEGRDIGFRYDGVVITGNGDGIQYLTPFEPE